MTADALLDLVESSCDFICTHDLGGRITYVNRAACKALGYSGDELRRMCISDILVDHTKPSFTSYIHELLSAGIVAGNMEIRTASGEKRLWQYHNVFLGGDPPMAGGIARDVTERERTFRTLTDSESHFRTLVESGADIVSIVDREGVVRYHSPSAVHALRYEPQELLGTSILALVHAEDRKQLVALMHQCCEERQAARIEIRLRHKNGAWRSFEVMMKPIGRGAKSALLLNARDVTERKLLEQQLERANRVDSLGRLAATVAHEFNNVLMGMTPFVELLQRKAPTPELLARATQHLLNSVQRGKRVTSDILRYTRRAEPNIAPVNLDEWWRNFIAEAQVLVGDDIRIITRMEPLTVMADANQLAQMFSNLISNARDAMPKGGEVSVVAHVPSPDEAFSFGFVGDPSRFVHLTVRDTGVGMSPDVLQHVFEPLFTTKTNRGTGLGLAVTHQMVARHGGYIFAESTPGDGAAFHLFFLKGTRVAAAAVVTERAQIAARRLLVVDDEDLIADGLRGLLASAGIKATTASSGAEALDVLHECDPDLVLLDIGLPDVDGSELARRIHERRPELPIIFMTGHGDVQRERTLYKPFEMEELLERIAEVERV